MGHSLRRWVALLLALAPCCFPSRAVDAAASRTRSARIYLQINAADGEPVRNLSAANFSLVGDQRRLPFTLANSTLRRQHNKASLPTTHLLVVPGPFLQGVTRPCDQLAPVLRARWKVQLLDTSGALRSDSTCGGAIQVVHRSERQALEALERANGRRVLLYVTTVNRALSHELQQRMAHAGITMYDVGGREPYFIDIQQYPSASIPTEPAQMSAATVEATRLGPANVSQPGIARPETSLNAALSDAIKDAAGAYVLGTRLEDAVDTLSLKLRHTQPGWTIVGWVVANHGPAPQLEITQ